MSVCKYDSATDTLTKVAGNGIMPTWKGTLAEWTSTDKTTLADGTIISITDDSEDDGVIYSATEHVIGKWLDGRDVYEKTYYASGTFTGQVILEPNIINVWDIVLESNGWVDCGSNGKWPIGKFWTQSDCYHISIHQNNQNGLSLYLTSTVIAYCVTVRYVKNA